MNTALHLASMNGDWAVAVFKILINANADVNSANVSYDINTACDSLCTSSQGIHPM